VRFACGCREGTTPCGLSSHTTVASGPCRLRQHGPTAQPQRSQGPHSLSAAASAPSLTAAALPQSTSQGRGAAVPSPPAAAAAHGQACKRKLDDEACGEAAPSLHAGARGAAAHKLPRWQDQPQCAVRWASGQGEVPAVGPDGLRQGPAVDGQLLGAESLDATHAAPASSHQRSPGAGLMMSPVHVALKREHEPAAEVAGCASASAVHTRTGQGGVFRPAEQQLHHQAEHTADDASPDASTSGRAGATGRGTQHRFQPNLAPGRPHAPRPPLPQPQAGHSDGPNSGGRPPGGMQGRGRGRGGPRGGRAWSVTTSAFTGRADREDVELHRAVAALRQESFEAG
jgi:hypothetical protein